jgi:hypothetical protein
MEKDPVTGLYTVFCKDGTIEHAVAKARVDSGDYCKQKSSPTSTQVNLKAFNAYLLWRNGKGAPMLDYPAGYDVRGGRIDPDGVFYVAEKTYWENQEFVASVTEGAKVEGDLLTYPTKEGRSLALMFSAPAENQITHANAAQYCKAKGLRLPHIQELFDFCAAGTAKNSDGRYSNNRCKGNPWWSASVPSDSRYYAWLFYGNYGYVNFYDRDNLSGGVRCVGSE